ncbi:hypothetical protein KC320_g256 [Hortaea werneckii]|nr:hypothetical protein KC320_g256 [Hortaea werneckii]
MGWKICTYWSFVALCIRVVGQSFPAAFETLGFAVKLILTSSPFPLLLSQEQAHGSRTAVRFDLPLAGCQPYSIPTSCNYTGVGLFPRSERCTPSNKKACLRQPRGQSLATGGASYHSSTPATIRFSTSLGLPLPVTATLPA